MRRGSGGSSANRQCLHGNRSGVIVMVTAGGTVFGTLGAMVVMPALLVGKRS